MDDRHVAVFLVEFHLKIDEAIVHEQHNIDPKDAGNHLEKASKEVPIGHFLRLAFLI